jgi:5,10-methylenetetrahydromethanopterin reductase
MAEENDYDSVWVSEDLAFRDAIVPLASLALSTQRIKLASGILPVYYRSPALAAMTIATLDELSQGRVILGLGNGVRSYVERQGIEFKHPLVAMEEYVSIIQRLLTGESITYDGLLYRLTEVKLSFKPLRPKIPIYVACRGPRMFQLAGKVADGALISDGFYTGDYIKWALDNIRIGAESAGRKARDVDLASLVWVSLSDDTNKAKEYVKPWLVDLLVGGALDPHLDRIRLSIDEVTRTKKAWASGDTKEAYASVTEEMLDLTAVYGTRDECAKKMQEFRSAGIGLPIIMPLAPKKKDTIASAKNW